MLKRPKSAVLLSLPYTFNSKQQAVDMKQKVKKSLLTFNTQSSVECDYYTDNRKLSVRSYVDNGPSLLNTSTQHYSLVEKGKSTKRSLQNSRAQSAISSRRSSKDLGAGLENYKRLKPCKVISEKSFKNLEDYLDDARKQSKFIDRVFENLSPRIQSTKKPQYQAPKKLLQKQKETKLQISGQNFTMFQSPKIQAKLIQDTPYYANVFQPTLQRKSSQLMKRSRAYLMTRG